MSYDPVVNPHPGQTPRASSFDDEELQPPTGFRDSQHYRDSSYSAPSFDSSKPLAPAAAYRDDPHNASSSSAFLEKDGVNAYPPSPPIQHSSIASGKRRRPWIWVVVAAALVAIVVAVIVPVYFKVIRKDGTAASSPDNSGGSSNDGGSGSTDGNGSGGAANPGLGQSDVITGGDGSTVTTETGATFTYHNSFGGFWVQDPNDPFNNNAQAQSWSKPLNQTWDWDNDRIRGVNLGGWLVPEPFIVPGLYEPFVNTSFPAVDEWTLSLNLANDTANGGLLGVMENHYKTFITEEDFAQIAAAGLNWIRLPIPYWAIQKYDDEPFLEGVAWKYALKAFAWARKYGLRINLDLHTMPGSQNGYNHSGRLGTINFLMGVMGVANAQRGLDYMRVVTEFINQPEYRNLIPLLGVVNEVRAKDIGMDVMGSFYLHMHDVLRNVTGLGTGNGPYLSIHDGFQGLSTWADFLPGKDRLAMDTHPYMCFSNVDPSPLSSQTKKPCNSWASSVNSSWSSFGVTTAGEWSLAINDCGLWVNNVGAGTRWEGTYAGYSGPTGTGSCEQWTDWQSWTTTQKGQFKQIAMSSMDALQNWFFWTWKIGNSTVSGKVEAPFWSYSLGLENGWIPTDPRTAIGACGGGSPAEKLSPSMTGGPGAGDFSGAVRTENPWPMSTLLPGPMDGTAVPTYTPTGPIPTLATPTFLNSQSKAIDGGSGWNNVQDNTPVYTPVSGCTYPDAWDSNGDGVEVPPACPAAAPNRFARNINAPLPKRTPAP